MIRVRSGMARRRRRGCGLRRRRCGRRASRSGMLVGDARRRIGPAVGRHAPRRRGDWASPPVPEASITAAGGVDPAAAPVRMGVCATRGVRHARGLSPYRGPARDTATDGGRAVSSGRARQWLGSSGARKGKGGARPASRAGWGKPSAIRYMDQAVARQPSPHGRRIASVTSIAPGRRTYRAQRGPSTLSRSRDRASQPRALRETDERRPRLGRQCRGRGDLRHRRSHRRSRARKP